MCVGCGLPTTHTNTLQTLSMTIALGSASFAILSVYFILTRAFIRKFLHRCLDKMFTNTVEGSKVE